MTRTRKAAVAVLALTLILGARTSNLRAQETQDQLQQLVAPVALYPDGLLAEVLAAATYPADVDAAAQWMAQNATVPPDQIATIADQMTWDPSVKALTAFPLVLASLGRNLAWTSALGDAYYNQPDDVMDAVQALRQRALAAGTLVDKPPIHVTNKDGVIVIDPSESDTISIPVYDCWGDYGAPISPWPDFVFMGTFSGRGIFWGAGIHIGGVFAKVDWGWKNWGFDWGHRRVMFQRNYFTSHSPSIVDRHYAPRPPAHGERPVPPVGRPPVAIARPAPPKPGMPVVKPGADPKGDRGFPQAKPTAPPSGTRAGAFTGINHGGTASNNSSHGQSSMGARPPAQSRPSGPSRSSAPPASHPSGPGRGRL